MKPSPPQPFYVLLMTIASFPPNTSHLSLNSTSLNMNILTWNVRGACGIDFKHIFIVSHILDMIILIKTRLSGECKLFYPLDSRTSLRLMQWASLVVFGFFGTLKPSMKNLLHLPFKKYTAEIS